MKLHELLTKELRSRYRVYLTGKEQSLTEYEEVFSGFFDPDDDEEVIDWKQSYNKYFDYEVIYFYATISSTNEPFIKVVIKESEDTTKLPF